MANEAPKLVMLTFQERTIIANMIRESRPTAQRYLREVAPLLPIEARARMESSARAAEALLLKVQS